MYRKAIEVAFNQNKSVNGGQDNEDKVLSGWLNKYVYEEL